MLSFTSKVILALGFLSKAADAGVIADPEQCVTAYAHDEGKAICARHSTEGTILWANGRYAFGQCDNDCDCDDCPTEPPAPNSPPSKAPTPSPTPLPQKCTGMSGSWSGDPHFKTFDRLDYDCQGEGEFEVVNSKYFRVQGRFIKFKENKRPTVTKAVVWQHKQGSEPKVQATVPENPVVLEGGFKSCAPHIHLDGVKIEKFMPAGATQTWLTPTIEIKYKKKGNLEGYIFFHSESKVQVEVMGKKSSANGCVISTKLCLPADWANDGNFVGLLGNADGDKWNDWMDRGNSEGPVPKGGKKERKFSKAFNWCKQWCIPEEPESLFLYEDGDSFVKQAKGCEQEADEETEKCCMDPDTHMPGLSAVCDAGDFACLTDGCAGGLEEAKDFLTTEAAQVDYGCGKELMKIDFSEDEAAKWGTIGYIRAAGKLGVDEVAQTGQIGVNPFLLFAPGISELMHVMHVPAMADLIEIEFKFIESGSWEKKDSGKSFKDTVFITIFDANGVAYDLDLKGFSRKDTNNNKDEYFSGTKNGIMWHRRALTPTGQNFGIGTSSDQGHDQLHKVVVQIPPAYYAITGTLILAFRKESDDIMEYSGVDDIRVLAYGIGCDIPADPDVQDDEGIVYEKACGEQVLAVDFTAMDAEGEQEWGNVVNTGHQNLLVLDAQSKDLELWHYGIPTFADLLVVEFDLYALRWDETLSKFVEGDWSACDGASGKKGDRNCNANKFEIFIGGKKIADLDTFEMGAQAKTEGKKRNIEWSRHMTTPNLVHVELVVPEEYFTADKYHSGGAGKDMQVKFDLNVRRTDIAVGLDDLRITTFANGCPGFGFEDETEHVEQHDRGRRKLRTFMQNMERPQSVAEGAYPRELGVEVKTDECTCLCPTLPGPSPSPGDLSAPRVMKLYADADVECEPSGPEIGTVTMTLTSDKKVDFEYKIKPEYSVDGAGVYVGATRLPVSSTDTYMKPYEFPYATDLSVTTGNVIADLLDCDYYAAAWVRVCGDFPEPEPQPEPVPQPQPQPQPAPEPVPQPQPQPQPAPEPEPVPQPQPQPAPEPVPQPQPVPEPITPALPATVAPTGSPRTPPPATDRPKTIAPTTTPATPAPSGGSASGDPHIVSWGGEKWDFHGGCDLVLIDNPSFHNGLGMTVHIRTKIVTWWSYIETAVVRIGDDTLEVTGGKDHQYVVNGVVGANNAEDFLFSSLGLKVHLKQATSKQLKVRIDYLNADAVAFEVFKDFVRVNVKMTDMKWKKFEGSVGLMGSYPHGEFIGRDGKTVFTDLNAFGQEWQVLESEPRLFHTIDGPQHPAQCMMPEEVSTEEKRRRLGESMLSREDAEVACARVGEGSRDACIFDVMATNDLDLAGSY